MSPDERRDEILAKYRRDPEPTSQKEEWPSCACCGSSLPDDRSYCAPCANAECGERHVDSPDVCNAELLRRGYKLLGPVVSDFTWRGGRIGLVRIELWRRPDGERAFGGVLEVLS